MENQDRVKQILLRMGKHLEKRPDEKLISGYSQAMKDYKETGNEQCRLAAEFIKREIDRRGIKLE